MHREEEKSYTIAQCTLHTILGLCVDTARHRDYNCAYLFLYQYVCETPSV